MQAATYPGTVTPLRGLTWFGEAERDVLFGRDHERDALARLVVSEGFRAGLLYGELGVGKTSLLRAGLVPHLRDHGVVAALCEEPTRPVESFAAALAQITGRPAASGETAAAFLARLVSEAMSGQQFLFILDEAETAVSVGGEPVVTELGELFARVVSRSGGRARFLFACASDRTHRLGALEKRTGSLFPPQNRFELERFTPEVAADVIDRTLALAGMVIDREMPRALARGAGNGGPVLPADLQLLALAARELGVGSPAALQKLGGAGELEAAWLRKVASQVGDERAVLRLLYEIGQAGAAVPAELAASQADVDPATARDVLARLVDKGVTRAVALPDSDDVHYALSHEVLARRVRDVAAPARAAARRAHDLIGAKATVNKRLTARELMAVKREGLLPSSDVERAVVARSQRFYRAAIALVAVALIGAVVAIYVVQAGRYYLDRDGERVVARGGRADLAIFHWLPAAPYGEVVAEPGLTRAAVEPAMWEQIVDRDLSGIRDGGDLADQVLAAMRPGRRAIIEYAAGGNDAVLAPLGKLDDPVQLAELLGLLALTARGTPGEEELVARALAHPSPTVQAAALEVATAAAGRVVGAYRATLERTLAAEDPARRRLAQAAMRRLEPISEERRPPRELGRPSPEAAADALRAGEVSAAARAAARVTLRRAFNAAPHESAIAAVELASDDKAAAGDRTYALALARELAPDSSFGELAANVRAIVDGGGELGLAALPLLARIEPSVSGELAARGKDRSPATQEAVALAWGEVARAGKDKAEAQAALEALLTADSPRVRGAAAEAYGHLGRPATAALVKLVKGDRPEVGYAAARGLTHAAAAGAPPGETIGPIVQLLWKKKGRARRAAADAFAALARIKPGPVLGHLAGAARASDDDELPPIAVAGLCNALVAGDRAAPRELGRAADGAPVELRRAVIECVADDARHHAQTGRIAVSLSTDGDGAVRREAARVLGELAAADKPGKDVGEALVRLTADDARDIRLLALRGLAALGEAAPKDAAAALPRAFERGDEGERLAALEAARRLGTGALAARATADPSPLVRVAGVETAVATGEGVGAAIGGALTDADPTVRRAALERLAGGGHGLSSEEVERALGVAIADSDPSIATVALTAMARLGDPGAVAARLAELLASPSESSRAMAVTACGGLAATDGGKAIALLEPMVADRSHDVRAALVPALARAYAVTRRPAELGRMLADAEDSATRRLAIAAGLALSASGEGGEAARVELLRAAGDGPPLGRLAARITVGLIEAKADVVGFLTALVP